jgi:GT2 family glycosyltransferase
MQPADYPLVTFIMPVLNEANRLRHCLDSIFALDYPQEKIDIQIAAGPSTDTTNNILTEYAQKHPNIHIHENPTGNTAIGRNICIKYANADFLMNYSGHTTAEKNLLNVLVTKLITAPPEIVSVGCANISPKKQNFAGKVAGIVFSSIMGGKNLFVQNAEFDTERFVDHISFACYRKQPVIDVGTFDPKFWCGQDAELDLRLLKKGYKILYTPDTKVYHFKRPTLRSLARQMYRYGIARAMMVKKHPKSLRIVHLIGPGFITGLILFLILTLLHLLPIWFLPMLLLIYLILCLISTLQLSRKPSIVISSVLFYLLTHLGYGAGFIRGILYGKL